MKKFGRFDFLKIERYNSRGFSARESGHDIVVDVAGGHGLVGPNRAAHVGHVSQKLAVGCVVSVRLRGVEGRGRMKPGDSPPRSTCSVEAIGPVPVLWVEN